MTKRDEPNVRLGLYRISVWALTLAASWLISVTVVTAADQAEFAAVDRIVVLSDVHGDYDRMREMLEIAEVTDRRGRWIAGKTHLVQLGDLPDRGPHSKQAAEFLRKLARSAKRKGGAVHLLIGNHEAMNVYGDLRYVDPGEYEEFRTRESKRFLEVVYEDEVAFIKANNPEEKWPEFDAEFKAKWMAARPLGWVEHRLSWEAGGDTNQWVQTRPAVIKIGDNLFMHGGLGPAFADWPIERLNEAVQRSLADPSDYRNSILREQDGPLWYRGLALGNEEAEQPHLDALLAQHDVKRIILGHTVTGGIILPRFGGQVLLTDVGLSSFYGDNMACLVIEGDRLTAVHRNGQVVLPASNQQDQLIDYVSAVAALEPSNKFIAQRLEQIRNPAETEDMVSPDPDEVGAEAGPTVD